uniref:Uncharacterized protein n=1 Tax=Physcomitrium patens TaxID=3218 RepID=A0A2K1K3T2_PHYPA|nr:hypothetical protein PHYPA_012905 [Physcomitrium patens]
MAQFERPNSIAEIFLNDDTKSIASRTGSKAGHRTRCALPCRRQFFTASVALLPLPLPDENATAAAAAAAVRCRRCPYYSYPLGGLGRTLTETRRIGDEKVEDASWT